MYMKKIQIAMVCLLAVAGMMMTGCKKEGEKVTLRAIIDTENDGKAYLNEDKFPVWESNDPIWVNGVQKSVTPSNSDLRKGTVADVEPADGYMAVYPYDANLSNNGTSVTVNIPRVQNFVPNDNNGQKIVPTMAAYTTGNTLLFKNLHSLIKVHVVNNTNADFTIKRIVVNSSSKITGSATAAMTASDVTALEMNSTSYNDATLEFDDEEPLANIAYNNTTGVDFYIAVAPLSNCPTFTVTLYTNDSKYIGVQFSDVSVDRSHIAPVSITASTTQPLKECGRFTVNSTGQQVNFSKSNLRVSRKVSTSGVTTEDRLLFTNQYDYVGDENSGNFNTYSTYNNQIDIYTNSRYPNQYLRDYTNGYIDLLGWGTGDNVLNFSSNKSNFSEWTVTRTDLYPGNWYTLNHTEWEYIIDNTSRTNLRFLKATVNGVKGLILFPDGFSWPSHVIASTTIYGKINSKTDNFTETITSTEWASLQNKGAVFLPAGGYRTLRGGCYRHVHNTDETGNIYEVQTNGYYWACDAVDADNAYCLHFSATDVDIVTTGYEKKRGHNVRLVKAVE